MNHPRGAMQAIKTPVKAGDRLNIKPRQQMILMMARIIIEKFDERHS
jgi:hypothetical protein